MSRHPVGATVHQLTQFLATVAGSTSVQEAVADAVERIAEVFDAELGAFVEDDKVVASIGYPAAAVPSRVLAAVASGADSSGTILLPGAGHQPVVVAPVDLQRGSVLLLARADEPLDPDDVSLLSGIAGVLGLALRMQGTIEAERAHRDRADREATENERLLSHLRHRQRLLELLTAIARSVVSRQPLGEVLDILTAGTSAQFDARMVTLCLREQHGNEKAGELAVRSAVGLDTTAIAQLSSSGGEGLSGLVVSENRVLVVDDYPATPFASLAVVDAGIKTAMAAPIVQDGRAVGCLFVGDDAAGRRFTRSEQDALSTLAEHAGIALNDSLVQEQLTLALDDAMHQATHDPLTGLPNRSLLTDRLAQALARARRNQTRVAVLFLDLDQFKTVNDTLGHAAGDQLLVTVSQRLAHHVRAGDTASRLGGDEFAVLLLDVADEAEATIAAERLLVAVSSEEPGSDELGSEEMGGERANVSVSIGVALSEPSDGPGDLLRNADVAMYSAKANGKNRVALFEPIR